MKIEFGKFMYLMANGAKKLVFHSLNRTAAGDLRSLPAPKGQM